MKTPAELQNDLAVRSGRRILLFLTNNRRHMVSVAARGVGPVEVRLQQMFLDAPDDVLAEIADMIARRPCGRARIRAFMRQLSPQDHPDTRPAAQPAPERRVGVHHDLERYAKNLNELYLGGRSKAPVLWGRRTRRRRRGTNSIRFGCYDPVTGQITINRRLDSPNVPGYFVQYVLFHEMLHEVLGIETSPDGRRSIHSPLFKMMEQTYPDFERARGFEQDLVNRLDEI